MKAETERESNIFEENESHSMKIETRDVKFENSEIQASKIDFSNRELASETIAELRDMGVFCDFA